ncbi:Trimethyllysine dioxygenase [Cyberlindnera fabianii]|uniref:trimethyllysine dioxygenase n=1 Tax=Cyberlindnera fabianii TaxID=36022 RepID=A0A1V2L5H7_CYBFA|nr:Trimethyllysine dioxygenase [Cyberlindnera fabianii]
MTNNYTIKDVSHNNETVIVTTEADNCQCDECYDSQTYQRVFDTYLVPEDVKAVSCSSTSESLTINWSDNHISTFTTEWLILHTSEYTKPTPHKDFLKPERIFWNKAYIEANKPTVPYSDVMKGNKKALLNNIHKYGFSFIHDIPHTAEDTEKMCESILPLRHTHYGGFWDFTTDLAMKDTAYSDIEIKSHTDGTYWEYTPYLQLFHLLFHNGEGGLTTLVDAFKCAQDLKREFPDDYETLSTIPIECHSLGDVHLVERKPVLIHDEDGELLQVSWNNCDRSSNYHMDNATLKKMYKAMRSWNTVISREDNVVWKKLVPGEALVFDNWRVLHARMKKTTGQRRMCGVYFDRYDFFSELRKVNCASEEELYKTST